MATTQPLSQKQLTPQRTVSMYDWLFFPSLYFHHLKWNTKLQRVTDFKLSTSLFLVQDVLSLPKTCKPHSFHNSLKTVSSYSGLHINFTCNSSSVRTGHLHFCLQRGSRSGSGSSLRGSKQPNNTCRYRQCWLGVRQRYMSKGDEPKECLNTLSVTQLQDWTLLSTSVMFTAEHVQMLPIPSYVFNPANREMLKCYHLICWWVTQKHLASKIEYGS